ncbi:MAG: peptide-methionine (S)-S-oxide reductase MsrA [Ignavibacteria bacterium]|nr:peptide-methionine (S)-S-oxide reductase MsrA [Ignavibacteria bacterium]MBK6772944.1 peptide-methionine (S)-S-oxide reductase MsrA [Ignavibacteria bacterium]MBK7159653.1 peptide-methionine (S)-S-oxide reductase MsrA [Ignavibacteria bacterium]
MKLKSVLTMTYLISLIFLFSNCSFTSKTEPKITNKQIINKQMSEKTDTAIFGAGCFWCVEAIFQRLKGVESIESGYTGGTVENPTYKQVCTGETGHAEVTKIIFNPDVISFNDLLEVFWTTHDPTTLNQQGADIGTQYRSAVFYLNDEQKMQAEKSKSEIATQIWDGTIVTEITPLKKYYKAEDYHQNYFNQNSDQSYCRFVINPKLEKFRKKFKDKIKDE